MKRFDILDRRQEIHRDYLLEASAGTGKTFSIENLVVRLLLEDHPEGGESISLEQILVVTFTRAATRDLKRRIRSNLENALQFFQTVNPSSFHSSIPDYLLLHLEKGEEAIRKGRRRLEQALFCFDTAQIFTIHGFCSRMLRHNVFEGDVRHGGIDEENSTFSDAQMRSVIHDFFRTELFSEHFSPIQLKIVLEAHSHSLDKLENDLLKIVKMGLPIAPLPDFITQLTLFRSLLFKFKEKFNWNAGDILADFIKQAPAYKDMVNRKRMVKEEHIVIVQRFASLFDQTEWGPHDFDSLLSDGLFFVTALDPSQLKPGGSPSSATDLHYPDILSILRQELLPLIDQARSPLAIKSRMASGCQKLLNHVLQEEEKLSFDDLLKAMRRALHSPPFAERVRHTYRAAIIDEFQDTDPIQWEIFRTLFLSENRSKCHLYLVGDPKQSIYAFRQADIYTYLEAAQLLGPSHHASLGINYRSQPALMEALNTLFSSEASPGLIALPRIGQSLRYQPVQPTPFPMTQQFCDRGASVQFCLAQAIEKSRQFPLEKLETHQFFPFFVQEILRLHQSDGIRFKQHAILVNDRFQAQRIAEHFKKWEIPTITQRSTQLTDSPAWEAIRELLQAIRQPSQESFLKTALGGHLIGWSHDHVRTLAESSVLEQVLGQCYALRRQWLTQGFARFFDLFMQSQWPFISQTVTEKLLTQAEGIDFLQDLQQIASLLIEQDYHKQTSPEALIAFLDQLATPEFAEDERLRRRSDHTRDGVNILTLHSSKGLEFDIVFALGLVSRNKPPEQLLPVNGCLELVLDKKSEKYKQHCDEIDAEKIRQLYVAMTRAKYRLYLPVALVPELAVPESGSASPMELFLARLGQPEIALESLYSRIQGHDGHILRQFIHSTSSSISVQQLNKALPQTIPLKKDSLVPLALVSPLKITVPDKPQFMHSFSTLAKKHFKSLPSLPKPHNEENLDKTPHTLPSSSETGNLLHHILETISVPSPLIHPDQLLSSIHPHVRGTSFIGWDSVISQIVFNALTTPLLVDQPSFCIANIPVNKRYQETEFIYFDTKINGYLKGVIDLIFFHEGKYYLLDWKSNWLGESMEAYTPDRLRQAMEDNDYFLQADIYQGALRRYLRLVDPQPFERVFGGIFYIFLRGLSLNAYGIYKISL